MNDLTGELVRERHDRALEAPHDPTRQLPMSPIRQPIGQVRQRRQFRQVPDEAPSLPSVTKARECPRDLAMDLAHALHLTEGHSVRSEVAPRKEPHDVDDPGRLIVTCRRQDRGRCPAERAADPGTGRQVVRARCVIAEICRSINSNGSAGGLTLTRNASSAARSRNVSSRSEPRRSQAPSSPYCGRGALRSVGGCAVSSTFSSRSIRRR